jgi:hypothetical protein
MKIIDAALLDPLIRAQLMDQIDIDAIIERRNIPKLKTVITIAVQQLVEKQLLQPQPGTPPKTNGNGGRIKEKA